MQPPPQIFLMRGWHRGAPGPELLIVHYYNYSALAHCYISNTLCMKEGTFWELMSASVFTIETGIKSGHDKVRCFGCAPTV